MKTLFPPGLPRPRGDANGVTATGRKVFVAGIIGCFNAAMTAVEASALSEDHAKVEIEVPAGVPA
jgi:hypothetical protein